MAAVATAPTYAGLLSDAEVVFRAAGVATPRLDAEVLLAMAMAADRAALYARLPEPVPSDIEERFLSAVVRRQGREPVAYITGMREFWSLPFAVTPAVLVPRPETELLVESVLRVLARRAGATVCDVGTGSGCVAVAVARAVPAARVVAIDISPEALQVARQNAAALGVSTRVTYTCHDLFEGLRPDTHFDVIVSNPPYVSQQEPLPPELGWEPTVAREAGADGLDVIRRLVDAAAIRLRDGGWLIMEFGVGQEASVRAYATAAGLQIQSVVDDLAGIARVLIARLPLAAPRN